MIFDRNSLLAGIKSHFNDTAAVFFFTETKRVQIPVSWKKWIQSRQLLLSKCNRNKITTTKTPKTCVALNRLGVILWRPVMIAAAWTHRCLLVTPRLLKATVGVKVNVA